MMPQPLKGLMTYYLKLMTYNLSLTTYNLIRYILRKKSWYKKFALYIPLGDGGKNKK